MDAGTIFGGISLAIALIAFLGAGVAYLRGGANKAENDRLRRISNDLRDEVTDKDRKIDEQQEEIKELQRNQVKMAEDLARKGAALIRIGEQAASGSEMRELGRQFAELVQVEKEHDREAATRHAAIIRELRSSRDTLKEIASALEGRAGDE